MKRLRILLAEDDAMIAVLLAEAISDMGHEVCAIEATEAGVVHAAAQYRPDLLIIDAQLRSGSGVLAVEAVMRADRIPYLLMSGGPVKAAPPGAVILEKPFDHVDLIAAMERVITDVSGRGSAIGLC